MNPIRRAFTAANNGLKALAMRFASSRWGWDWFASRSRFDYAGAVGDGTGNSAVMAPVLWIARTFPEAPVRLQQLKGDDEYDTVRRHKMLNLLRKPNDFYSGHTLWMATMVDYTVTGNAYWLLVPNREGEPVEAWWTPKSLVTPKYPEDGSAYISHYEYRAGNGEPIEWDPRYVVHFRYGLDPKNIRLGLSPLASVLREVFTDDEAANFSSTILCNLGVPGLIISPDSGDRVLSDEQYQAGKEYINASFGGDNRGMPMVMRGATKAQILSFSPEQMNLRDLRKIPEERVTAVLGVPAIVAGLGAGLDRSTFANMSEAREMAYESNIIPSQRLLGEELRTQLLSLFEPDIDSFVVDFDLSGVRVLSEDQNRIATRIDLAVKGGYLAVDVAQKELGLPVDDTQHVYLRPLNVVAVAADTPIDAGELDDEEAKGHAVGDRSLEIGRLTLDVQRLEELGEMDEAQQLREELRQLVLGGSTEKAKQNGHSKAPIPV